MKLFIRTVFIIALTWVFSSARTDFSFSLKGRLVEVNGDSIAYVPHTAKYVTYNGQIRQIVGFATTLSKADQNCACPNCCEGRCYVIVYTDVASICGPIIILSILWVKC